MGRRRAVIKDVSKVAAAVRAMNLGSDHAEGSVDGCLDSTLDRIIEAGPASPAFELTFGLAPNQISSAATRTEPSASSNPAFSF